MGFLASLFGREHIESRQAQEKVRAPKNIEDGLEKRDDEPASQGISSANPQLKVGERLEVLVDGLPLFSGMVASVNGSSLALKREQNQIALGICETGTEVHIRGCASGGVPFYLKGIVVESTKTAFKVKELAVIAYNELAHSELRSDFRLVVNEPASLYAQEDTHLQHPEECSLVNISAGGACIQSEFLHGEDEVLWLKIRLKNYAPMTFLGQVVRTSEPRPGVFQYGFLFAQLDEQASKNLTKMLMNIRNGNTSVHYRHDYGHW